jgi:dTDP-4-dehydrorhamnose reductase
MTDAPAILVVGGDGFVGRVLTAHFRARGDRVIETTRRVGRTAADVLTLDLAADPGAWPALPPLRGAVLCAAIARLQDCERDPAASRRVNVDAPAALAQRLAVAGVPTVFLSSDKVFDGRMAQRRRFDLTCATTEYGRQKAAAERAMPRDVAILRLSKVVSPTVELFQAWVRDLRAGRPITPFEDLTMAPIRVELVAETVSRLLDERRSGIFHLTGDRDVSYVEAAHIVATAIGAAPALVQARPSGTVPPPVQHTTLAMDWEAERWRLASPPTTETLRRLAAELASGAAT